MLPGLPGFELHPSPFIFLALSNLLFEKVYERIDFVALNLNRSTGSFLLPRGSLLPLKGGDVCRSLLLKYISDRIRALSLICFLLLG